MELRFDPPVPNLAALADGATAGGHFRIASDPSAGEIAGTWRLERNGDEVRVAMHPSEGWRPSPDRLSLRILYRLVRMFREWPSTYHWDAVIQLDDEGGTMRSHWSRSSE